MSALGTVALVVGVAAGWLLSCAVYEERIRVYEQRIRQLRTLLRPRLLELQPAVAAAPPADLDEMVTAAGDRAELAVAARHALRGPGPHHAAASPAPTCVTGEFDLITSTLLLDVSDVV